MGRKEEELLRAAREMSANAAAANSAKAPDSGAEELRARLRVEAAKMSAGEYVPTDEPVDAERRRGVGQEELQDYPLSEDLTRKARLLGGGAVRGAGDIVGLPAMVLDQQFRPPVGPAASGEGFALGAGEGRLPRPPLLAPPIQAGAGVLQRGVQGDVTPQSTGDRYTQYLGEEGAAGGPVAWYLRRLAKAKTAAGSVNKFWVAQSGESTGQFAIGEGLGAAGSAGGRLVFEEGSPLAEMGGAVAGDLLIRNVPGIGVRTWRGTVGFLGMKFESIEKQQARMQREIIDVLRREGGIEEFAATKKGRMLLNEAAEYYQRAAGREFNVDAAMSMIDELEQYAAEFGLTLDDIALPSMLANPGLFSLVTEAIARNPDLAAHYFAATERGSSKVRRKLARMGAPEYTQADDASRLDTTRAVAEGEVARRKDAVAEELERLKAQRKAAVDAQDEASIGALGEHLADEGGVGELAGDAAQKLRASTEFSEALIENWLGKRPRNVRRAVPRRGARAPARRRTPRPQARERAGDGRWAAQGARFRRSARGGPRGGPDALHDERG